MPTLTKKQLKQIDKIQIGMQKRFRTVPEEGVKVRYLEKEFIVYKNVFWPFEDNKTLVENYTVNSGEDVLDVCTGSGVIAIFSAYKGARKAVAVDFNPEAVRTAKENARLHGFSQSIDVRLSDMFQAIRDDEMFDVITGNLPFRNKKASDLVEASQWDTNLYAHRKFFSGVGKHLKPNGRIYLCQANFGAVKEMRQLANDSGFAMRLIGKNEMPGNDPRIFYAFELNRKNENPTNQAAI